MRYLPFALLLIMAGASGQGLAEAPEPLLPEVESRADSPDINLVDSPRAGWASYYADKFHGRKTASGERFDQQGLTAASNQLPLGTRVAVRRAGSEHCVLVRVNDRMARRHGWLRILDLTKLAATQLQMLQAGVVQVQVQAMEGDGLTQQAACRVAFGIEPVANVPEAAEANLHPPGGEPSLPDLSQTEP